MKWEDFENNYIKQYELNVQTDIECPKCGEYLIKDNIVIATNPPTYKYFCKNCGWSGTTNACY